MSVITYARSNPEFTGALNTNVKPYKLKVGNRISGTIEEIVTKDVYVKFPCRSALRSMAEELSKFHNALPLMDGKIDRITKKKIYAIFESKKTRQRWPIILYREQAPRYNPVTGISLGSDTKIIASCFYHWKK